MNESKTYSCVLGGGLPALDAMAMAIAIASPGRQIKIKSVFWALQICASPGDSELLNLNTQTTQIYSLEIGNSVDPLFLTEFFTPSVAFPPAFQFNADRILLYSPGQIFFDSLEVKNNIVFRYNAINRDALLSYTHSCSIVVETEENLL